MLLTTDDITTESKDFSLEQYCSMIRKRDLIVEDYQRKFRKDFKKASKIIESILLHIPIPEVQLFRHRSEGMEEMLSVIDGQQRIISISMFLQNQFELKNLEILTEFNGKTFGELPRAQQRQLENATIRANVISSDKEDIKYEIFLRLNRGSTKLTEQEIRNCEFYGSFNFMLKQIINENSELVNDIFGGENLDQSYEERILRAIALSESFPINNDIKSEITSYMKNHRNDSKDDINKQKTKFISTFKLTKQIFGSDFFRQTYDKKTHKFKNCVFRGGIFDSIFVALSKFDKNSLINCADKIRENVIDTIMNDEEYLYFATKWTANKTNVNGRINKIIDVINKCISDVEPDAVERDSRRLFTNEEKTYLWESQENHICPLCNQNILSFDDAEVDHIIPWSKGGKTIIENAQLTHTFCNRHKSNILFQDIENLI